MARYRFFYLVFLIVSIVLMFAYKSCYFAGSVICFTSVDEIFTESADRIQDAFDREV